MSKKKIYIYKQRVAERIKLLARSSPQVPQHNQAVLSQGGRRGADVRRHRGGELQGCEAVAHQCPGPTLYPL